jgi:choline dehydrogenase-like flavoprotein
MSEPFDLVVVGTGFASSFFLHEYLLHAPENARVLVLEKGRKIPYAWKREHNANSDVRFNGLIDNRTPEKPWVQNIAFGGGACWTGNAPRFLPSDFTMKTDHGISDDWPFDYAELEPYYVETEALMGIAGDEAGPYPRSAPYTCPPHALSAFDQLIAAKYPGQFMPMPSARSSSSAVTHRPRCCADGICSVCPVTSKFQVDLHFTAIYDDPRVRLLTEASAERLETTGGQVDAVVYQHDGRELRAACELAAVGAHAILTPFLLLRSGFDDPALGAYLNEQIIVNVQLDLDGVQNFDGGQGVSGWGTMLLEHAKRAEYAGCAVEGWNVPWLRAERGRWRERGFLKLVFEDVPQAESRVSIATPDATKPEIHYAGHSEWLRRGFSHLDTTVEGLLEGLPVETYKIFRPGDSEDESLGGSAHIQGTTRMGADPETSVVDGGLRHHKVRNLCVLGSGAFPSCPAGNPTLTLSALSLRAARRLFASQGA